MLRTDERLLLTDALTPPDGARLDTLVGTTYSLQLGALLSVPLSLTFVDWEDEQGAPTSEPVAALAAIRNLADRITVFCQAGATAVSEQPPLVASWLENIVVPVKAPFGGVFHAKVWIARYSRSGGASCYRVLCGSRNLTFDRCWDTVAVIDGEPSPRGGIVPDSRPLADFVEALPGFATAVIDPARAAAVGALAKDLRRVRFRAPDGFSDVSFWPMGIATNQSDPLGSTRRRRMLVMSPFVGQTRLANLAGEQLDGIVISRGDELDKVATAGLEGFAKFYVISEPEVAEEPDARESALSGLHAKLYVADNGPDAHVWSGSANATSAAAERNVEFLVRLDGKRKDWGIDALMDREPGGLRAMLQEIEPREYAGEPDAHEQLLRELDDLAHRLAEGRITATVTGSPTPDEFCVALTAGDAHELAADLIVTCWPLTGVADRDRQPVALDTIELAQFTHQRLEKITAFYVFELELSRGAETARTEMIVRADLVDVPSGRHDAIVRDLLRDPEQVMRLIRALLNFDATGAPTAVAKALGGGGGEWGRADDAPLLESLLRALDEAPDQLDAIDVLLGDLAKNQDLFPPGLLDICMPILSVRKEALA